MILSAAPVGSFFGGPVAADVSYTHSLAHLLTLSSAHFFFSLAHSLTHALTHTHYLLAHTHYLLAYTTLCREKRRRANQVVAKISSL